MKISEFCIQRPVFATVINLLILLFGMISFKFLTVREFPNINAPIVSVSTNYFGASAEIIESRITRPIEDVLAGVEGLDFMQSSSKDEVSEITLQFHMNYPMEQATNTVRDRISQARAMMPKEAQEPIVAKMEADAEPIIWLAFFSDQHDLMQISDFSDRVVKDRVEILPGVARVFTAGERKKSMRIWLNNDKLAAFNLTPGDVETALLKQNVEIPAGRVESADVEFTVYAKTDLQSIPDFENLVLSESEGHLIKLQDVARIEIGPHYDRFITRYNSRPAVGLGIIKQSTANPLDIRAALEKAVPEIQANLPKGMEMTIAYDSTEAIKQSIHSVYKALFEAVALVVLVIFFFLRSFRATIIPLLTIPIALIGSFGIMYVLGFSINTLTLLAMVLAIGLVVDDAIVVLENIHRHIESGLKPLEAAIKGIREIGTAVVAMTLTLMAVFAPVAFAEGRVGKLFTEFAVVLAGSVLLSGFTALTLSPMMCGKFIRQEEKKHSALYNAIEVALDKVSTSYQSALAFCLQHPKKIMFGLAIAIGLNVVLYQTLNHELAPAEDRGFAIAIGMSPEGSTIGYTDRYANQIEAFLNEIPEVDRYFTAVGYPNVKQVFAFAGLTDWSKRERSQQAVVQELSGKLFTIPGLMSFAINPPSSIDEGGFGGSVSVVMQQSGSFDEMKLVVDQVIQKASTYPGISNIDSDLKLNKPQIEMVVNRDKAASLGIEIDEIGHTLEILFGGLQVTHFKSDGKQYDVILQADPTRRQDPSNIESVFMRTDQGEMVHLANLIYIEETVAASTLNHFNKLPATVISATLNEGYALSDALDFLTNTIREVGKEKVQVDYTGASRAFMQAKSSLSTTFILALVVIFLVLAAQFESFKHPFVILLSVPLAVMGALLTLHLTKGSLNLFSQIGLITLIGLISKHGILIVEFANQLRSQGEALQAAIVKAASLRFRPILMTTAATVFGTLPLAFAVGSGAESRQEIGWVIVGGMTIGTLFTLFVIPIVYCLFLATTTSSTTKE
ncbi:MAG: efflux RND transporter permease subunit [Gammaproteobacteria bacterium]